MRGLVTAITVLLLAAGIVVATPPDTDGDGDGGAAGTVRFVAIGDFGTGSQGQYDVASGIADVCAARGCDFVIGLGDNVYDVGVADEYDAQFESKFEQPYADLDLPFYMTLGNHDNSHDPISQGPVGTALPAAVADEGVGAGHWFEAGNREVAYHYRENRTSDKWFMPARFYDFDAGPAAFFAMDTNTLMYGSVPFPPIGWTAEKQELAVMDWLDRSGASPWRIAFGHHPYISNGQHGNAGNYEGAPMTPISGPYIKAFYETFLCDEVDLVIAGHDHELQWLAPTSACGDTHHFVSGAGAKARTFPDHGSLSEDFFRVHNDAVWEQDQQLGFFWFELRGDGTGDVAAYAWPKGTPPATAVPAHAGPIAAI